MGGGAGRCTHSVDLHCFLFVFSEAVRDAGGVRAVHAVSVPVAAVDTGARAVHPRLVRPAAQAARHSAQGRVRGTYSAQTPSNRNHPRTTRTFLTKILTSEVGSVGHL